MHVCVHMYLFLHTLIEEHRMFPCACIYGYTYTLHLLSMMSKHVVIPWTFQPIVGRAFPNFTTSWTHVLLTPPLPLCHPLAPHVPKLYGLLHLRVGPACCNSMAGYDFVVTPTIRNDSENFRMYVSLSSEPMTSLPLQAHWMLKFRFDHNSFKQYLGINILLFLNFSFLGGWGVLSKNSEPLHLSLYGSKWHPEDANSCFYFFSTISVSLCIYLNYTTLIFT
jgi:hypothetical protein